MDQYQPMTYGYAPQPMGIQQNYGGYPIGYPPVYPQGQAYPQQGSSIYSPFIQQPIQQQSFIPDFNNNPIEVTTRDGNTTIIPPSNTGYTQGGIRENQGGFNPVTGTMAPQIAGAGFNPYTVYVGNPGYQQTPIQNPSSPNGFSPFYPGQQMYYNPQLYLQNEFNTYIQDVIYNTPTNIGIDVRDILEDIILTEEEREKINHKRNSYMYTDYYGRPAYDNSYNESQERQKQINEARLNHQKIFTMISRIAHAYSGEKINEEEAMRRFDPFIEVNQPFNIYTASDKEKKEYTLEQEQDYLANVDRAIETQKQNEELLVQQKAAIYSKIKESHDRLLGIEPGQHYSLKTYMENGYKLGVEIAFRKAKSLNRNGTNKYSQTGFRANLSKDVNASVPITSKDDEYISIEEALTRVYDRNRAQNQILQTRKGDIIISQDDYRDVNSAEYSYHQNFMEAVQDKKNLDDVKRAVV